MNRPRIDIDATGSKYLTVFYSEGDNYDNVIREGFRFHKISEAESVTIPVVVLPKNKGGYISDK
jgi:hypothetical protein